MKKYEQVVGEAVRVEYTEKDGKLFLVFEITNEQKKQFIRSNWFNDIEFKMIDKLLISND